METEKRAFKTLVKDVESLLTENPEHIKLFKKFAREGVLNDAGGTASYSLADNPGRKVFLRRDGKRWFVEDRQQDEIKPIPKSDK